MRLTFWVFVFASEKFGSLLFSFNNRKVNAFTAKVAISIPQMDECVDALGEAQIVSRLYSTSCPSQIETEEYAATKLRLHPIIDCTGLMVWSLVQKANRAHSSAQRAWIDRQSRINLFLSTFTVLVNSARQYVFTSLIPVQALAYCPMPVCH